MVRAWSLQLLVRQGQPASLCPLLLGLSLPSSNVLEGLSPGLG